MSFSEDNNFNAEDAEAAEDQDDWKRGRQRCQYDLEFLILSPNSATSAFNICSYKALR